MHNQGCTAHAILATCSIIFPFRFWSRTFALNFSRKVSISFRLWPHCHLVLFGAYDPQRAQKYHVQWLIMIRIIKPGYLHICTFSWQDECLQGDMTMFHKVSGSWLQNSVKTFVCVLVFKIVHCWQLVSYVTHRHIHTHTHTHKLRECLFAHDHCLPPCGQN